MPSQCSLFLPRRSLTGERVSRHFHARPSHQQCHWEVLARRGVLWSRGHTSTMQWQKLPNKHRILLTFHQYWPVLKPVTEKRKVPFPITRYPIPLENIC